MIRMPVTPKIKSLESGRAVAALSVVASHATLAAEDFLGPLPKQVSAIFGRGYLGVDFFFVLSGFIIYYTNAGRQPDYAWTVNFGESRLIRIFVPYLPIGLGMAALYTLVPHLSASARDWSWFASATLLPTSSPTALSVAWTLRHELVFYGLFLLFFSLRKPFLGVGAWAAICASYHVLWGEPTGAARFALGLINVEFFAGMLAAEAVLKSVRWPLKSMGFALIACFLLLGAERSQSILFGCGLACWIVSIVRAELALKFEVPDWLFFLGGASYAIYLAHDSTVSVAARLVRNIPSPTTAFLLFILAGALAGIAYHLIWERPILAWVKGRRKRTKLATESRIGGAGPQIP